MRTRATTSVRRTAACLTLAGAGFAFAGGGAAWATPMTPAPACGTTAHPALYSTTHHEAVPAVTHLVKVVDTAFVPGRAGTDEVSHLDFTKVDGEGAPDGEGWRTSGKNWTIEDTPAYTRYGWLRTVIDRAAVAPVPAVPASTHEETVVEEAWVETVIEPAKRAVDEESHWITVVDKDAWKETVVDQGGYAYTQKETGKLKYRDSGSWNGEDNNHGNDYGWSRAPELDRTSVVDHEAVTHQQKVIDRAASPAVPEVTRLVHHEAVAHTKTVTDTPEVPAVEAVEELSHVETAWTLGADTPPEGEGWYPSGEEVYVDATTHVGHEWMRTVVDVPAAEAVPEVAEVSHLETVVDEAEVAAWDEQVLESEATPAGPACPTAVLGETAPVAGSAHAAAAIAPTAVSAETLAHTGTDLAVPFGAGLAFVFVGGGLVAAGRGRRD